MYAGIGSFFVSDRIFCGLCLFDFDCLAGSIVFLAAGTVSAKERIFPKARRYESPTSL